jgi:Archaeal phage integrase
MTDSNTERGSPRPAVRAGSNLVGRGIANPFFAAAAADNNNNNDNECSRPTRFPPALAGLGSSSSFKDYLKTQNKRNSRQIICYANRFVSILTNGDASPLMALTSTKRRHTMEALTVYSKYLGCYDRWCEIRKRYSLHWTDGNDSLQALQRFFDTNLTLESMLSRIKEMMRVLDAPYGELIRFACITGLRPSEACESVRLLSSAAELTNYYNKDQQCLEHFRFPDIFLRPTKKAYLSYLSTDNYQRIASLGSRTPTPTWNAIRLACRRRNINMDMRLCRKVFASWLIQSGIDAATVDLLQGRVGQSVLVRHYQSPTASLRDRVLDAVSQLQQQAL